MNNDFPWVLMAGQIGRYIKYTDPKSAPQDHHGKEGPLSLISSSDITRLKQRWRVLGPVTLLGFVRAKRIVLASGSGERSRVSPQQKTSLRFARGWLGVPREWTQQSNRRRRKSQSEASKIGIT